MFLLLTFGLSALPLNNSWLSAKPGHGFWSFILRYLYPPKSFFQKFLMTSLHEIFGLPPLNQKSLVRLCTRGRGILGRAPQITVCVPQSKVNFCISTRGPTKLLPQNTSPQTLFFHETAGQIEWTWSSSLRFCDEDLYLFIFWYSPPNLRKKSIPKAENIGFGAKYSPDCCRIPNAFGFGCVSAPQNFCTPETHYSGARPVTILFYLQCTNYTVVCDQIANKSSLFVLLNASILKKYRGLQVFSYLSKCNYRVFVYEILLEIGFIEIGFISSDWLATRPHYLFNFGSEKIGPRAIKLAYTCTSNDKRSQR